MTPLLLSKPVPLRPDRMNRPVAALLAVLALASASARASIAYGSINNFDTVNDTGTECHGFEIELEDCHSTDITYTYDYNHYGTPKITEDNSVAGHPKCVIRWESGKKPDGTWAAYTAIPSVPISPTNGHQFTNPSINFGGEHFGVGYRVQPTAIRYHWLVDNGAGVLVHGGAVQVATPSFTYFPPAAGVVAPAQVQAVIVPPAEPPPPKEFGNAVWVKEIRTKTHNNKEIKLRELVSDDPDAEDDKNWANGEPDEVEVEWRLLQKSRVAPDGGPNAELAGAPENLPGGDEVVTRRYEFYKYTGCFDGESNEAMCDAVGPDRVHGTGSVTYNDHVNPATGEWVKATVDTATLEVVGEFVGAQMAAVDVDAPVGLIDHLQNGTLNAPYPARTVVVQGALPFTAASDGALPPGMTFDEVSGVVEGTPTTAGEYVFQITADDGVNPPVAKNYTVMVAAAGAAVAPFALLDTAASPLGAGSTSGDGSFDVGTNATAAATASPGFRFVNWTDNGVVMSTNPSYTLQMDVNHSLVANFTVDVPQWSITAGASPVAGGTVAGGGLADDGSSVTLTASTNAGYRFANWTEGGTVVSSSANYTFTVGADRVLVANFTAVPTYAVSVDTLPAAGGTTTGGGSYSSGTSATVTATPGAGHVFSKWTAGGAQVSTSASYTFTVTANRSLVANFIAAGTAQVIATSASPTAGGTTSGGGNYLSGDTATVEAVANPNYKFSKWQESGATASNSSSYTFTVAGSRNLVAKFVEAFVITANVSPGIGGATEMDSADYKTGERAKAKAIPEPGFQFLNWTENGTVVSTDVDYEFDVTGPRTLVAHFVSDTGVTVSMSGSPANGGSVTGDGVYGSGDSVVASAVAAPGYAFVKWTENGADVSTDADYCFTADTNRALVACFGAVVPVAATASPAAGGTVEGAGDYGAGAAVVLAATPAEGYLFTGWSDGTTVLSSTPEYAFTVTGARNLVANFLAVPQVASAPAAGEGNAFEVSWPVDAPGWVLEESPDLSPGSWRPSTRTLTVAGGRKRVSIPNPTGKGYFRLAHP